jgi:hypothetical protein
MPLKDEESPADYNYGGYLPVKVGDAFKDGRYTIVRKLGYDPPFLFVVGPSQFALVGATFPPYGSSRTLCTSFRPLALSVSDLLQLAATGRNVIRH